MTEEIDAFEKETLDSFMEHVHRHAADASSVLTLVSSLYLSCLEAAKIPPTDVKCIFDNLCVEYADKYFSDVEGHSK